MKNLEEKIQNINKDFPDYPCHLDEKIFAAIHTQSAAPSRNMTWRFSIISLSLCLCVGTGLWIYYSQKDTATGTTVSFEEQKTYHLETSAGEFAIAYRISIPKKEFLVGDTFSVTMSAGHTIIDSQSFPVASFEVFITAPNFIIKNRSSIEVNNFGTLDNYMDLKSEELIYPSKVDFMLEVSSIMENSSINVGFRLQLSDTTGDNGTEGEVFNENHEFLTTTQGNMIVIENN